MGSRGDFLAAIHQEDRPAVEAAIGRAAAGEGEGDGFDVEYRVPLPGGGFRWLRFQRAVTQRGEDGAPLRMSGVVTNVTERAEAEQAPIESEARFRAIADAMPQMASSVGPDGRTDYWNARAYEFTGRDPGSLGSFAREDIIHPDDLPALREAWNRTRETGEPFEMEHRPHYRDGTYRCVLARALAVRGARC
ncbi:PAS domain-containing protein [Roseomonas sp. GCM10028921]